MYVLGYVDEIVIQKYKANVKLQLPLERKNCQIIPDYSKMKATSI